MSLIVFEGLDKAGKTSLSLRLVQYLNKSFRGDDGLLKIDPHFGDYVWTREPSFGREISTELNAIDYMDEYGREASFFESRLNHQKFLAGKNVVCDRYIWSGLAYSKVLSPNCYELLRRFYLKDTFFIYPDVYVLVDTPPEICYDRDTTLDLKVLQAIKRAFDDTRTYIHCPVLTIPSVGGEDKAFEELTEKFTELYDITLDRY